MMIDDMEGGMGYHLYPAKYVYEWNSQSQWMPPIYYAANPPDIVDTERCSEKEADCWELFRVEDGVLIPIETFDTLYDARRYAERNEFDVEEYYE